MNRLSKLLIALSITLFACKKPGSSVVDPPPPTPAKLLTIKAADGSFIPEIRASGIVLKNSSGQAEDMLATLKAGGVNTIRLRLWHTPAGGHSGFSEVKTFAQEIKNAGMKVWLTVHYSDTWADPGKQTKPAAWSSISYSLLKDSVYAYTRKIATEIAPDYIQIGNEINSGFLWPDGNISNQAQLLELLGQGIKAVRDNAPQTKIMLHNAGISNASYIFGIFNSLNYDIIALSYYPIYHGKSLDNVSSTLNTLGTQYSKDIVIAETSYPFTFGYNDYTNNILGTADQILPEFPATPQGQKDYVTRIKKLVTDAPKGIGISYWGGEWISFKGSTATNGSTWENQALWDFNNQALPAIGAFKD